MQITLCESACIDGLCSNLIAKTFTQVSVCLFFIGDLNPKFLELYLAKSQVRKTEGNGKLPTKCHDIQGYTEHMIKPFTAGKHREVHFGKI